MAALNKNKIITVVQDKVNALNVANSADEFLLPNVDNLDPNKTSFIDKIDDLPDLLTDNLPSGQIIFVQELRLPVVANKLKWLTLDGKIIRDDAPNWTGWAWGVNDRLQLGTGLSTSASSPTSVVGNISWKQIVAGDCHSGGITFDGTAWMWGQGFGGRLGNGSTSNRNSPVSVLGGFTNWSKLALGGTHSIGLRDNGTVWTWGINNNGELGDGTTGYANLKCSPVSIIGGFTDWCDISADYRSSTGLRSNGTIWTWGANGVGQLGDGTLNNRSSPVSLAGNISDWVKLGDGFGSRFAIRSNGTLWGWSSNYNGTLGIGVAGAESEPTPALTGIDGVTKIVTGYRRSALLKNNGTIWVWGEGYNGLGDGTTSQRSSPVSVVGGFTDWCDISSNYLSFLGVRANGTIWSWGSNDRGELGDGTVVNRSSPVSVVGGITNWTQISGGRHHSLATQSNGTLWSWGDGSSGQLGDSTCINRSSPVTVVGGFTDWCQSTGGEWHSAALRTNGTLWTFGANNCGQLGDGTTIDRSSPVTVVGGFTDWCQVTAGGVLSEVTSAVRSNCTIWNWGANWGYFLATGTDTAYCSPISVPSVSANWCKVFTNGKRSFGQKLTGELWMWGYNDQGEAGVGIPYYGSIVYPSPVCCNFTDWSFVAVNPGFYETTFGIRPGGCVWAWGLRRFAAFGDGIQYNCTSPVEVCGGFTDWCQVSSGNRHTGGIRKNGTLWTWGLSRFGALGQNDVCQRKEPTEVMKGSTNWCQVSVGYFYNSAAVKQDATLWTWGYGTRGQRGDGTAIDGKSSPAQIPGSWCSVSFGGGHGLGIKGA